MSQYRFSPDIVSRGKGQSVIAKAAYNAREDIRDERTGETKRHAHRPGLEFAGIFAPKNAPEWMKNRAKLWNGVELQEDGTTRHATAQLARNIEVNLPHELSKDQRRQLVRDFVREQFVREGMVADVAIHAPHEKGDERNYHAHILLTLREIDGDGFSAEKARHWNSKEFNLQWREKWAELGARYLEKAGFAKEAERYSYGHFDKEKQRQIALERGDHEHAQALEGPATTHKGPQIVAMERRGMETDRGSSIKRESFTATQETAKLKQELATIERQIAALEHARTELPRETQAGQAKGKEWQTPTPEPVRTSPEYHFEDAARSVADPQPTPDAPSRLRGTSAAIWTAYNATRDPYRFAATLEEKGIRMAVVTKDEAERSKAEAEHWKAHGEHRPTYREGEFVAVNRQGDVYRFTERNTGQDQEAVQAFLTKAVFKGLASLDGTQQIVQKEIATRVSQRQARSSEIAAARLERAGIIHDKAPVNDNTRPLAQSADRMGKIGVRAGRKAMMIGGVALHAIASALESLFAPPTPKTPEQIKEEHKHREAAANENESAFAKYARDTEDERIRLREIDAARRQVEREQYERLERERGGRER
jgi:hypothetical protein